MSSVLISKIMQSNKTMTRVDEQDPDTFVICLECGTKHPQITHTHLKKAHEMKLDEYRSKHNLDKSDLFCTNVRELRKVTLENMIKKYGVEEGTRKWNQYREKQARSNSFEYKQEKHGWTRDQYNDYNDSRASTKENFIKRHGEEEGTKRWKAYCDRQSYAGVTEEYFVEKYGPIEGVKKFKEVCSKKSHTLDGYIQKFGEIVGRERWERFVGVAAEGVPQSKPANEMFMSILERLPADRHQCIFFGEKNHEYFLMKKGYKTLFLDFFDLSTKKVIEFAGDYWHGNPDVYGPEYFNTRTRCTAKELYDKTLERNKILEEVHGCKVLLIWENDYKKDKQNTINKCLEFLNE